MELHRVKWRSEVPGAYAERYRSLRSLILGIFIGGIIADTWALILGLDVKLFWAYFSTAITIAGYAIYISQMYPPTGRPAVKPEPLSWILFGFLTATGAIVQIEQGANTGSWCLVTTAAACFVIAGWSYLMWRHEWKFDALYGITAIGAIGLFAFSVATARNPTLATRSAVLATLADLVSYGPTFRKAWSRPSEDSITNFGFNSVKCIPALLALESYSVATMIYLLMLTIVNGGFAVFLQIRRYQLGKLGGDRL